MRTPLVSLLLAAVCINSSRAESVHLRDEPVTRIAFGSCYKTEGDQIVWATIAARNPDILVLLGDNVYADTRDEAALRAKWGELAYQWAKHSVARVRPTIAPSQAQRTGQRGAALMGWWTPGRGRSL